MALEFAQITAITERHFIPKLVDGVYNSAAFTARLARPDKLQLKDGGHEILAPIMSSQPGIGGYYDDLDTLSNDRTDNITSSKHQWRQLFEPIRVSRKELLQNNGDAAKLSLVQSKVQIAERQMRENLALGIFSDGDTGTGALTTDQLDGLQAVVDTTSTYGGIAVADFDDWKAESNNNSSVDRPLSLNLMQQVFGSVSEDGDTPSVLTCKQDVYDQVWSLYQPHQRLMSQEMSDLGFENVLTFNGRPIVVDSHCQAKTIYFLNEDYLFLCVHKDENMRRETLERLETSNSMLMRIFWMGNLVCNNRRFQGELVDIEVAA
jgi:hypothetical protein